MVAQLKIRHLQTAAAYTGILPVITEILKAQAQIALPAVHWIGICGRCRERSRTAAVQLKACRCEAEITCAVAGIVQGGNFLLAKGAVPDGDVVEGAKESFITIPRT